jgi:signal transduction histidine kinase
MYVNRGLSQSLVPDELIARIDRDADASGGQLSDTQASAWRGYLAALHESGALDMADLTVVLMRIAALYPGSLDDSVFDGLSVPARVRLEGDVADVDLRLARLRQLGFQMADMLDPDSILPVMLRTLVESLQVPYAAIYAQHADGQAGDAMLEEYAPRKITPARMFELPLTRRGETVGRVRVGFENNDDRLNDATMQVLRDFAMRSGPAVFIVRAIHDLRRAGEQLVFAREEERRLLRRNLHDSIGPTLAALNLRSGAIRKLIASDPATADAQMGELREQIREVIADIRRVVHNLRPPALDELGLLSAIHEQARQFSAGDFKVFVDAPEMLPPLNAAAEVAAFRIVSEGLANVLRHAQAHNCWIRIVLEREMLTVEILDDGVGMDPGKSLGVGLMSMRQRALELGGRCIFQSAPQQGTLVRASLPLRGSSTASPAPREPSTINELRAQQSEPINQENKSL